MKLIIYLLSFILWNKVDCVQTKENVNLATKSCSVVEQSSQIIKSCIFPFKFEFNTHYACTNKNRTDGKFWCPTKVDPVWSGVDEESQDWGYCGEDCFQTVATCTSVLGSKCIFPFNLTDGSSYDGCFWKNSREGFVCPVAIHENEYVMENCNADCPQECPHHFWKCGNHCISTEFACNQDTCVPNGNDYIICNGKCLESHKYWKCDNDCIDIESPCHGVCSKEYDYSGPDCDGKCRSSYLDIENWFCNGECKNITEPCNSECVHPNFGVDNLGVCELETRTTTFLCNGKSQRVSVPCHGKCHIEGERINCDGLCEGYPDSVLCNGVCQPVEKTCNGQCNDPKVNISCNGLCESEATVFECEDKCINLTLPCNGVCQEGRIMDCDGHCQLPDGLYLSLESMWQCEGKCINITEACNGHCLVDDLKLNCNGFCEANLSYHTCGGECVHYDIPCNGKCLFPHFEIDCDGKCYDEKTHYTCEGKCLTIDTPCKGKCGAEDYVLNCDGKCESRYTAERYDCDGSCISKNNPCNGKCLTSSDVINCNGECEWGQHLTEYRCNGECQSIELPCDGICPPSRILDCVPATSESPGDCVKVKCYRFEDLRECGSRNVTQDVPCNGICSGRELNCLGKCEEELSVKMCNGKCQDVNILCE